MLLLWLGKALNTDMSVHDHKVKKTRSSRHMKELIQQIRNYSKLLSVTT